MAGGTRKKKKLHEKRRKRKRGGKKCWAAVYSLSPEKPTLQVEEEEKKRPKKKANMDPHTNLTWIGKLLGVRKVQKRKKKGEEKKGGCEDSTFREALLLNFFNFLENKRKKTRGREEKKRPCFFLFYTR